MGRTPWRKNEINGPWPPLPLIANNTVIEQPVDLSKLAVNYVQKAIDFITRQTNNDQPWVLYIPFSHVHSPQYSNPVHCISSIRGFFGDAIEEMDWIIGQIMAKINELLIDRNTLTFFTSDNGPAQDRIAGGSHHLFHGWKDTTWEVL